MRKVSETDILRPWKARLDAKRRTELAQPRAVHLRRFAKGVLAIIETDEASRWTSFSVRPIFNEVLSIKGFLFWRKWGKLVTLFYSLVQREATERRYQMLFYGDTTLLGACTRLGIPGTNACIITGFAESTKEKKPVLA